MVDQNRQQGSRIDERRSLNGARIDDENDGGVEIVVIPVPTDPCWVGRIRVGGRHQSQQDGDEEDDEGLLKHAVMIVRVRTAVKRLMRSPARRARDMKTTSGPTLRATFAPQHRDTAAL